MVGAQNLQVPQLIPHAQLVVCLKLVTVAGAADTLKVFAAVWIPCPQSPNESCRNDVVHVAPGPGLLEIYFTKLHFASSSKRRDSMTFPTPARWALARPLPVHAFPTYRLLLRPKSRLAELTAAVTVCLAPRKQSFEDLRLAIFAVRTTHNREPPFNWNDCPRKQRPPRRIPGIDKEVGLFCESVESRQSWDTLVGSLVMTCGWRVVTYIFT
jgi:hypothetical protein